MKTLRRLTRRALMVSMALLALTAITAVAQVSITVITRSPMPAELSAWRRDRSLVQVSFTNPAGAPACADARVAFEIRNAETGAMVARSRDDHPTMPRITIPAGMSATLRSGADLIDERAVDVDARLRDVARATNALPEGRYEFCVRLIGRDGREIPSTGMRCGRFSVALPTPPVPVAPRDGSALTDDRPTFLWTPSTPMPATPPRYQLRIVPVYAGQSASGAIETNRPLAERIVTGTSYQWQPTDPAFTSGTATRFAWQVNLFREDGIVVRSSVSTFALTADSTPSASLTPVNPFTTVIPPAAGPLAGGGGVGKGKKKGGDLGNIGAIKGDCDKPHSVGIKLTFPNVAGINSFPAEILKIDGIDAAIADVSTDGETITVKCKKTGTFTITVKLRALPLGLAPMTDVYTAQITIICDCDPKQGGGKDGGNGGRDGGGNGGGNDGGNGGVRLGDGAGTSGSDANGTGAVDAGAVNAGAVNAGTGAVNIGAPNPCTKEFAWTICLGSTITPFYPKNPKITGNSNRDVASAGIDNNGGVQITGNAVGTTTITVDVQVYDEMHQLVHCTWIMKITVVRCGSDGKPLKEGSLPPTLDSFFDVFTTVDGDQVRGK